MYSVNGEYPDYSSSLCELCAGDYVQWIYTKSIGEDIGGGSYIGGGTSSEKVVLPGEISPSVTADKTRTASVSVSKAMIESASKNAMNEITVCPDIKGIADKISIKFVKSAVAAFESDRKLNLRISTGIADVTIPNKELAETPGEFKIVISKEWDTVRIELFRGGNIISEASDITVFIPKEKLSESSVPMADGAKILKKSAVTENGIKTIINGSTSLKITENEKIFKDVENHWAEDYISYVSARGIFNGTGTEFDPDKPLSRAMAVTALSRLEDPTDSDSAKFSDVSGNAWYKEAVSWAVCSNIAVGFGDKFEPEKEITREQLCVMLFRYMGNTENEFRLQEEFSDLDKVSSWAVNGVSWAIENNIISGKPGKIIDPSGNATRAEAAAIFKRVIELMVGK